jgi:hypothetical protein
MDPSPSAHGGFSSPRATPHAHWQSSPAGGYTKWKQGDLLMTRLVLTHEQSRLVAESREPIQVCDPQGDVLTTIEPPEFTPEEIAEAAKAADSNEPRYSTQQVLDHLRSLASK